VKTGLFFLVMISMLLAMGGEPIQEPTSSVTAELVETMPTGNMPIDPAEYDLSKKIIQKLNTDIDISLTKIELPDSALSGERLTTQLILPTGIDAEEVIVVIGPYYQQKLDSQPTGVFSGEITIPVDMPKGSQEIAYHIRTELHQYQLQRRLVIN